MKLAADAVELLCAAFLLRAARVDDVDLMRIKRQADFASAFKGGLGVSLNDDEASVVLERLIELGIFSRAQDRFTNGFIHAVGSPRDKLNMLSKNVSTPYYYANQIGMEWLQEALASSALLSELSDPSLELVSSIAPAADRLVTLNHNSGALHHMVKQVEEAEEVIRASNSIDPDATSWIRMHIQAGLQLLSGKKVILSAISALLIKPLMTAYESVSEEPARQAILAAIHAVRSLFGI